MKTQKQTIAEQKEARKNQAFAILNNCPTSPRKMRLVADTIRGIEVQKALGYLKFSSKAPARSLYQLLTSAIVNWQAKNENLRLEDVNLYVSRIFVNQGRMLKRIQPAPQGRAHSILKRSNHVTIYVDKI